MSRMSRRAEKNERIRILITDCEGPYNKGDLAILLSMLHVLKKMNAEFIVLSHNSGALMRYFYEKTRNLPFLKVYPMPINTFRSTRSRVIWRAKAMAVLVWALLRKSGLNVRIEFFSKNLETIEVINQYITADIIISCGGEYFRDSMNVLLNMFQFFKTLYGLLLAKFLEKPVVLYAQSLGPFYSISFKTLVRFVLNKVDLIVLRDDRSRENLEKIGVCKPKIHVTADAALLLPAISAKQARKILLEEGIARDNKEQMLIGISTLQHSEFPNLKSFKNYKKVIAHLADYLINTYSCKICFISHTEYPRTLAPYDDYRVALQIIELMKNKKRVKAISTLRYTPSEIKGVIGQLDLFIGTRMHTLIFAAPMNVPLVAIAYSFKHMEFMGMLGQSDKVCDIARTDFSVVKNMIVNTLENRTYIKRMLKTKVRSLQNRAMQTANLVSNFINESC